MRQPRSFTSVPARRVAYRLARRAVSLLALLLALLPGVARAATWTVTIRAHELEALTNSDTWGEQDMYWKVHMKPLVGSGAPVDCDTEDNHPDDDNKIKVDWGCVMTLSGGPDASAEIVVEVYDEDSTSGDDELDLNIDHAQLGVVLRFEPRTSKLEIIGNPQFTPGKCLPGRVKVSGFGGGGDEPAELTFSLSASAASAVDGDSDGDGILDTAEICGLDGNGDGIMDVNLPAMGADPARKDVFVEIDWMSAPGGAAAHGHEPWLPALVNAWNELNVAPVTNPTIAGVVKPGGIALHVDVGTLYANYGFDTNLDGTPELPVGGPTAAGNIELSGDGIPDIGNLGLLGGGLRLGGNVLAEDPSLGPPPQPPLPPGAPPPPITAAQIFAPGSDFAAIKAANFDPARDTIFHYVVFAHAYPQVVGGPANSSGLAEPCGSGPCNEVIVSLGTYARQTVDTNLDGIPDTAPPVPPGAPPPPPPAVLNGPAGLPVDGTVRQHTGTFMHELGHNFGLLHGGADSINWKPNFLSLMNYSFQFIGLAYDWNGDNNADAVGLDFDGDGVQDLQRYQYSSFAGGPPMPALNEGATPPPPAVNETTAPAPWTRLITRYTCPPVVTAAGPQPPVVQSVRIFQPIDWNCAAGTTIPVDINNVNLQSGPPPEILNGFDDSNRLQNGGLDSDPTTGIGRDEHRQLQAASQRIIEPSGREEFVQQCVKPRRLDFEDQAHGTVISGQYAPDVIFVADELRTPRIAGPADRNNVPTSSPGQSLLNYPRGGAVAPLAFSFGELQRVVQLSFGQAGIAHAQREGVRAVIEAFDQDDLPMGRIVRALPLPPTGITEQVTISAVYPDQLIRRMEVRYEIGQATFNSPPAALLAEPVQIDDLLFCAKLDERSLHPIVQAPPKFGELPAVLDIRSEALMEVAGTGTEPGNTSTIPWAFTGLGVNVDGAAFTTDTSITRPEGTTLKLVAPATSSVGPFLYWRYGNGISFGRGVDTISLTLLRNSTLTAVYQGRRHERPQSPDQPSLLERVKALRQCLAVDCLGLFRDRQ